MRIKNLTGFSPVKLQSYRSEYNYPKAFLQFSDQKNRNGEIKLPGGRLAVFCHPVNNAITDECLDVYHKNLLNSEDSDEIVLGLASVIYWGYYTFGHSYAANKVNWFINGRSDQNPTDKETAFNCLGAARQYANQESLDRAIASLSGLNQLSRTPFASKVIAFMAPDRSGVYDNKIQNGIAQRGYPEIFSRGVGAVSSPAIQKRYQAWCRYLTEVAGLMNQNPDWRWSCGNDAVREWRSLDVERAFFAAFMNN